MILAEVATLARDVGALLVGLVTGALSGAFGIGGAVISTPGVRLLGASPLLAVGTTIPPILPGAVAGVARYAREGLVVWPVVAIVAPVGAVASVLGSLASHAVPGEGHWLGVLTAVLVGVTARQAVRKPAETQACDASELEGARRRLVPAGVGALAGLLSGLLGVGGGVVLIPGFLRAVRLELKPAIATSLTCVGVLAVPSAVAHALLGDIDWRLSALLTVAVVPGARLGAAASLRAEDRRLRMAVAVMLGVVAVVYAVGETAGALS
jgi:uncharacterized membrane protein YfcA